MSRPYPLIDLHAQVCLYYEDIAHVLVRRANVILYVDVTHRKIIGERSDAADAARRVLATVLQRLG